MSNLSDEDKQKNKPFWGKLMLLEKKRKHF